MVQVDLGETGSVKRSPFTGRGPQEFAFLNKEELGFSVNETNHLPRAGDPVNFDIRACDPFHPVLDMEGLISLPSHTAIPGRENCLATKSTHPWHNPLHDGAQAAVAIARYRSGSPLVLPRSYEPR